MSGMSPRPHHQVTYSNAPILYGGTVGQCTRDSNRDIARHCKTAGRSPPEANQCEPYQNTEPTKSDEAGRNISQHSRNPPPGIRGILPVVPPQTGVYAADAYRPGSDEWQQCTGNKPFPWSPEGRHDGIVYTQREGEEEPVSWAGRCFAFGEFSKSICSDRHPRGGGRPYSGDG